MVAPFRSDDVPAHVHAEQIPAAMSPGLTEEEAAAREKDGMNAFCNVSSAPLLTCKLGGIVRLDFAIAVLKPHETGEHRSEPESNAEHDRIAYC